MREGLLEGFSLGRYLLLIDPSTANQSKVRIEVCPDSILRGGLPMQSKEDELW